MDRYGRMWPWYIGSLGRLGECMNLPFSKGVCSWRRSWSEPSDRSPNYSARNPHFRWWRWSKCHARGNTGWDNTLFWRSPCRNGTGLWQWPCWCSPLDLFHHAEKIGTFKVRACPSIITEKRVVGNPEIAAVIAEDFLLGFNRYACAVLLVVVTQTAVAGGDNFLALHCFLQNSCKAVGGLL